MRRFSGAFESPLIEIETATLKRRTPRGAAYTWGVADRRYRNLKLVRHEAVWRGRRLEVVRPALPIRHAYPASPGDSFYAFVDGRACLRIAALAWYAAQHKEALVHVPLRGPMPAAIEGWVGHPLRACDLVFVHHSLAFRPSAWRDVRNRLGRGAPATVSIERPGEWLWDRFEIPRHTAPDRDVLDFAHHSDTIFLVGSRPALAHVAGYFTWMATAHDLGDHGHLRGIARHDDSYKCPAGDDLIISHYTDGLARAWEESRARMRAEETGS